MDRTRVRFREYKLGASWQNSIQSSCTEESAAQEGNECRETGLGLWLIADHGSQI
jgi:hypothetical protein